VRCIFSTRTNLRTIPTGDGNRPPGPTEARLTALDRPAATCSACLGGPQPPARPILSAGPDRSAAGRRAMSEGHPGPVLSGRRPALDLYPRAEIAKVVLR
jgi:hypothetical protein